MLAQISAYMANANNEQRRSETGSCELSRLGSSEATERLGLQKARVTRREDMEIYMGSRVARRQRKNEVVECELLAQKGGEKERRHNGTD